MNNSLVKVVETTETFSLLVSLKARINIEEEKHYEKQCIGRD